jgi:hypothetical protein
MRLHWPKGLITPHDVYTMTKDHPHKVLFYLSVGGWLGLIIHQLTNCH